MQDRNTKKILIISVAGLIALRIFLLFLIPYLPHLEQYKISNIPDIEHPWYSRHFSAIKEGDDKSYYDMAEMINNFQFKESERTLGYPLMIAPLISLFGKDSFSGAFFTLIIFNSIFLFSAALILIVWISFLVFKKIAPALLSGFLFLLFPFIFYIFRSYGPQFKVATWNDINFMGMNWLAVMADQPAALFSLLVLFLLLVAERKKAEPFFYALVGFVAGYSAMVRISNIVIVFAAALVIFIYESGKKYKKLIFYSVFSLIGFLPQFIYNVVFFGSPIKFGYQESYRGWIDLGVPDVPIFSIGNVLHLLNRATDYSWLVIPALLLVLVFISFGILYVKKNSKPLALALALWFFLPVLFYASFITGTTTMRYYIPAIGPFVILSSAALFAIGDWLKVKFFCDKIN